MSIETINKSLGRINHDVSAVRQALVELLELENENERLRNQLSSVRGMIQELRLKLHKYEPPERYMGPENRRSPADQDG